jgi:HSP20 family protein
MRSLLPMFSSGFFNDNALDHFFDGFGEFPNSFKFPKVDIEDKKDHYEVTADMPGFSKDQITVTYQDRVLTIEALRNESKETKEKDRQFICRERGTSSFKRQFIVDGIKKEAIRADLKDGILTISLPKETKSAPADTGRIEIK